MIILAGTSTNDACRILCLCTDPSVRSAGLNLSRGTPSNTVSGPATDASSPLTMHNRSAWQRRESTSWPRQKTPDPRAMALTSSCVALASNGPPTLHVDPEAPSTREQWPLSAPDVSSDDAVKTSVRKATTETHASVDDRMHELVFEHSVLRRRV